MNLSKMWELQKELDLNISETHNLVENEELLQKKILALNVELGELANEWRGFKFWSNKEASPREVLLEEYVDCLHFVLSIGNQMKLKKDSIVFFKVDDLENQFMDCYIYSCRLYDNKNPKNYFSLIENLISLGSNLGLKNDEIEEAYLSKNQKNNKRQEEGY